ncbi:MAG: MaoC family dehydratase [Desulfobacteraceae bacterium]
MLNTVKEGDVLPAIEQHIDQDRIMQWARISGDYNRLHVDPDYAKQTRFKGTIAHGPLSLAFLNQLMMRCFDREWVLGGRLMDVRFTAPIRPGDRISIGGTIIRIYREGADRFAECELAIRKSDGETAVLGRSVCRITGEKE